MEEPKIVMARGSRRVAWNKSYSPHGYRLSEVISAVGKEIRRGKDEMAIFWALQMMLSGLEAEQFLWERFRVIAVEDIGPEIGQLVHRNSDPEGIQQHGGRQWKTSKLTSSSVSKPSVQPRKSSRH